MECLCPIHFTKKIVIDSNYVSQGYIFAWRKLHIFWKTLNNSFTWKAFLKILFKMFHWSKRITPRNLIYGNLLQTLLCEIKSTQKCIYSGIISPAWHISCWNKALRYNFLQNHFQKGIFPHSRIFVISYCNKKEQKLILWTFGFIKDNV